MSLDLSHTSPYLLNINIGSKYYMFISFIKHISCTIQTNSVSFHQPNVWKKIESVHVCLVLKICLIIVIWSGTRNLENLLLFPQKQPWTILSRICAPLNCEPKIIRMRPTSGLLLITESIIASLTYLFINQIKKYSAHAWLVLKHVSHYY